jgi:DNA polymerase-1
MERLVLVDGSNLVYRAYFALPKSLMTADGLHTNAIYGFATMFRKLFAGRLPAMGAVIFDAPGGSHRDALFADYKGTREAMPNELSAQLPRVFELCELSGFRLLRIPGVEADDVIGTLAKLALDAGYEVQIISSDKDFAQLICDRLRLVDTLRDVTFDAEVARKKWGVTPDQMIDYLSLVGDTVDNIPGVAGIGDKSAVELLQSFGSLDGIYAELDLPADSSKIKGRQRKALLENRDNAFLSRTLATIKLDVPLGLTLSDLRVIPPEPEALNRFYVAHQFYSLLGEEAKASLTRKSTPSNHETVTDTAEVTSLLARLGPSALLPVFDEDPPVIAPIIGLALSDTPGKAYYLPLRGRGPTLETAAVSALVAFLEDASKPKICHDMKELYRGLRRLEPAVELRGTVFDTRLASFLIDPNKIIPHRLDQLSKEYLQRTIPAPKSIVGTGQKLIRYSEVDVDKVAAYASELVDVIISAHPALVSRLESEGQTKELLDHELPLSYVLAEMELAGVLVDKSDLERLGVEFRATLAELEGRIWREAGHEFNIGSTKQLADVLFEELKLPTGKKTKTGYSTDAEVLEALADSHEIGRLLVEHRKLAKLINTYTDVLTRSIYPKTGRIHATFNQTTGVTGRLISTDPDLQRTPVHTPEGKRIRHAFIAPPHHRLLVADWSQIELRILAHVTRDPHLVHAFTHREDVHRRTAGQIFGLAPDAVTSEQRNIGKTINFATIYGQGASALAQMLKISPKDAKRYIESYFRYYAGVRRWLDETTEQALRDGYVTTLHGRRRYIPELSSNSNMERQAGIRIACNTPIQGSAADLCKDVMLALPKRLRDAGLSARMLLQIHDELVFEVPDAEAEATAALVKDAMEHTVELDVPLVADVGVGRSWADAKG